MRRVNVLIRRALLAVAGALVAQSLWAHAVVTGSTLATQSVRPGVPAKVVLTFNSALEIGLSRVFLVRKGDVLSPVPIEAGSRHGELEVSLPALEAGDYALKLRVLAADGHVTEDVIRFRVADRAD